MSSVNGAHKDYSLYEVCRSSQTYKLNSNICAITTAKIFRIGRLRKKWVNSVEVLKNMNIKLLSTKQKKYCKNKNINLLIISYKDINIIKDILKNNKIIPSQAS